MKRCIQGANDLATVNPKLADEWHPMKNGSLTPEQVTYGSHKKVWWLGKCGHEWEAVINNRNKGSSCPVCAGKQKLTADYNLATVNPKLASDWHPTKNGDLTPANVARSSGIKAWWLGSCGHEWQATISSRNKGAGCPFCSGRLVLFGFNDLATANPKLASEWHPTKNGDLTSEQVTFGSHKGVWWQCSKGHEWQARVDDRKRGRGCPICSGGSFLIGFNDLATTHPELTKEWHPTKNGNLLPSQVMAGHNKKVWWQCSKGHEWQAPPITRTSQKTGCPVCKNRKLLQGYNDLATMNPELVPEWHPTKNRYLLPSQVMSGSNQKVWWQCSKGHEWQAVVYSRSAGSGCPICSNNQVLPGYNDLATVNPKLASEWHPTKNGDLKPSEIVAGSAKKVWWQCSKGHEWQAKILSRNKGIGCPCCSKKRKLN